jgi:peptidoglycan/xylan/chitin deacetylase (PgdA/CDA1 family)
MNPLVLMSFDVEEFDIPLEYNYNIDVSEQMQKGKEGLDALLPILNEHQIATTLFTTANFAVHFPEAIQQLSNHHEIASHTFYHSAFKNEDLLQSKITLEKITGKKVTGLRMPRMRYVAMEEVIKAGYTYDSSINPTWLPGRYNNFHLPRTKYVDEGMIRLPASVSPNLRLPLFWLGFKNYPYALFKRLALQTLRKDGYLCLYFHPWEFTEINHYNLPNYVKRLCGVGLQERLHRLITDLKQEATFTTIENFLSNN